MEPNQNRQHADVTPASFNMSEFASWCSYRQYAASVTREWRFTRSPDQIAFIVRFFQTQARGTTPFKQAPHSGAHNKGTIGTIGTMKKKGAECGSLTL